MSAKIRGSVQASHAVMADGHDRGIFGPGLQDLLSEALIREDTAFDSCNFVFLWRADVHQLDLAGPL